MKVYIEQILIINFIIDFILLYSTKKLLNRKTSIKKIILSSLIGSILSITLVSHNLIKLIISLIMILLVFGYKNIMNNLIYFYLLSIILGGFLYLIDINIYNINYIVLIILPPIIIYLYIKEIIKYKTHFSNIYQIEIQIESNIYKLNALLDTGNELIDPYKKRPIILTNLDIDYTKYKYLLVPFSALNNSGTIPCIKPDKIIINNKIYTNFLIGISKIKFNLKDAECILPNKLKEEL